MTRAPALDAPPAVRLFRPDPGRSPRRILVRGGRVVGEMEIDRYRERSRLEIAETAADGAEARRLARVLATLGVPSRAALAWVYDLRVAARWRGQGVARQALAQVFSARPGVILLQLGSATGARMAPAARREAYRRLGFHLLQCNGMELGARWDGGVSNPEEKKRPRQG